jgi:hypothetical protein
LLIELEGEKNWISRIGVFIASEDLEEKINGEQKV